MTARPRLELVDADRPGPRLVTEPLRRRVESVDVLRGIVMVIMALDHTRDFFGIFGANPTNIATTTVPLFFTRFITHICAPTFFLLTGVGAGLARASRTSAELSRYLITRGLLLIVLEATLLRSLAYQFNFDYQVTLLIVIWALGWAMIFLGLIGQYLSRVFEEVKGRPIYLLKQIPRDNQRST